EHLRMYGAPERRPGAGAAAPAAPKAQPPDDPSKSGKRKTSSLVFLDVDAPPVAKGPPVKGRVAIPPKPVPEPEPEPALDPEPAVESLIEPVTAEPDTSLEIESTSLVEGLEATNAGGTLEGFETTSAEFGDIDLDAADVPSLRDEVAPEDIPPPAEFEPTVPEEASASDSAVELQPLLETEIEIEAPKAKAPPRVAPVVPKRPAVGAPPRFAGGEALIEAGERERGIEELDLATTGFETRGNLPQAQDLVDEILRLDPNSVRHRQKQVEFAFKSGDKAKLIDAYVELADTLLRSDL